MRIWAWECGVNERYCEPLTSRRNGPGMALDEKPKFGLRVFNQAYFDHLRTRVAAAGQRGIYVSIMLFQTLQVYAITALQQAYIHNNPLDIGTSAHRQWQRQ